MTISSIGGIDLILDADTNNIGEDQNGRIVMRQDGGQVVGPMGYREATNQLEIMQEYDSDLVLGTNSVDRLEIDPFGNVGIGTTAPTYALHVVSDTGSRVIYALNTATSALTYGVWGQTNSDISGSTGVLGVAFTLSGITAGVRGSTNSPNGYGVFSTGA